jgi:hypothetical protein
MTTLLIGSTSQTTYTGTNGRLYSGTFTCAYSGTATEIRFWCQTSCNVKVAIYDAGSATRTRLGVNNTGTACTGGQINSVSITDTELTDGVTYNVSIISDTDSFLGLESASGGDYEYLDSGSYAAGCPSTYTSPTNGVFIVTIASYGVITHEDTTDTASAVATPASVDAGRLLSSVIDTASAVASAGGPDASSATQSVIDTASAVATPASVDAGRLLSSVIDTASAVATPASVDAGRLLSSALDAASAVASAGGPDASLATQSALDTASAVATPASVTGGRLLSSALDTAYAVATPASVTGGRLLSSVLDTASAAATPANVTGGRLLSSVLDTASAVATPASVAGARLLSSDLDTASAVASAATIRTVDGLSELGASGSLGDVGAIKAVVSGLGTLTAFTRLGHPADYRTWKEIIPLSSRRDNYVIIRDKIAEILAKELLIQQSLATDGGYDPDDYKADVYSERMNPWERYRDNDSNTTPIINVWYDGGTADLRRSTLTRTLMVSRYNIDCISYAVSTETESGHTPGDEAAAEKAQRIALLVRRILMHPKYKMLGLEKGVVWNRIITSATAFKEKPESMQQIAALQLVLEVEHIETIDINDLGSEMDHINVKVYHEPDGLVRSELLYR